MKAVRIVLSVLSLLVMVLAFAVPGAMLARGAGWIARVQLVPAILAGSVASLVLLVVLIALLGRLYCSVICPLGISQDLVRGVAKLCRIPAQRLRAGRTLWIVRLSCLAAFVVLCCMGLTGLFEPYGIFGRFLSVGVLQLGDPGTLTVVWALALFILIVGVGVFVPRLWCNVFCPVGTFLGLFSCFAFFRVRINEEKCVKCGLCAKVCETGALTQGEDRAIALDLSRCVMCGNCHGSCKKAALTWR